MAAILQMIFSNESYSFCFDFHIKLHWIMFIWVIDNKPVLVLIMAWCRTCNRPLSEQIRATAWLGFDGLNWHKIFVVFCFVMVKFSVLVVPNETFTHILEHCVTSTGPSLWPQYMIHSIVYNEEALAVPHNPFNDIVIPCKKSHREL